MGWRNTVQISYGMPYFLMYFVVFYATYGVRNLLSNSFIFIHTMMAISNMTCWLNAWIFLKLTDENFFFPYYEWLSGFQFLLNTHSFLLNHFYFMQNIDVLLLSFDRFAAIYGAVSADMTWWKKYYHVIAVVIHIGALGADLFPRLPMTTVFSVVNGVYSTGPDPEDVSKYVQLVFGFLIFIVCLALNITSYRTLYALRMIASAATVKRETSFLVFSSTVFLAQVLNLAMTTVLVIFRTTTLIPVIYRPAIIDIISFTSDIFSLLPAITIIILPGPVRRFLLTRSFVQRIVGIFCKPVNRFITRVHPQQKISSLP